MIFKRIIHALLGTPKAPKRYAQLFESIRNIRPKNILEIGTWTGSRALQMIETAKEFTPAREIHYYGFDLFEEFTEGAMSKELSKRPPSLAEVTAKLSVTGAGIHLYKGNTQETLPKTVHSLPLMDVIFIDGGHSIKTVENDWRFTSSLVSGKGVIIFDDYWENRTEAGAKPTVDTIDRERFSVELMPVVDSVRNTEFGELIIRFAKVKKRRNTTEKGGKGL